MKVELTANDNDNGVVRYKFEIENDNPLFDEWINIISVKDLSSKVRVWHCGKIKTIKADDIISIVTGN